MTLRQLHFFKTVCDFGSISLAAQHLRISQQGVSKAISELEKELDCKLFYRSNSGTTLTRYGSYLLQECSIILRKADYITSHIQQMKASPKEPLVVGISFGILSALPPETLSSFSNAYPDIELTYIDAPDYRLENEMKSGKCDAALTVGFNEFDQYTLEALKKERVFLCIPSSHPFYRAKEIRMEQLKDEKFVMFSTEFQVCHDFASSCMHAGFLPEVLFFSNDFNSLKELAHTTASLFIVPEHTVRTNDPHFSYLPFPDPYLNWVIYFATRKNRLMTESILAFYNHLKKIMAL